MGRLLQAPLKPLQARLPTGTGIAMYTAVSLAARGHGVARELLAEMVHVANRRGLSAVRGENEDDPR